MTIEILQEAELDLLDGFQFYEHQEKGLGGYFLDTLFSDIDSLRLCAGIHSTHHGYHRLLSPRFPFAVYYTLEQDVVRIWAVLDCRQNPARTRERLTEPE